MGCPVIGNDDEHKVLHFLNFTGYGGCFAGHQTVLCFGGSSVGCAVSIGVGAGRRFGRSVSDKIGGAALRRDGVGLSGHGSFFGKIRFRSDLSLGWNGFSRSVFAACRSEQQNRGEKNGTCKRKFFHNFPHFCAHFLRISSLCQVRADTNLVIEKFYFSICMPPFFYYVQKKMSYAAGFKKGLLGVRLEK